MKPAWDTLAEEFKDSKRVVIADVDCTAAGEPICSRFKVEGFPTLKSFSPLDTEGEDYDGGRELDELRGLSTNASDYLVALEQREREKTGISTLKVGYNRVHGYYIEISRAQSAQAPVEYTRRQTLKNAERFITPELKEFEDKLLKEKQNAENPNLRDFFYNTWLILVNFTCDH